MSACAEAIRRDISEFRGPLAKRLAFTKGEESAADYIFRRMREYTTDVERDSFDAPDNAPFFFAAHLAEFVMVALVAKWWPLASLIYGGFVLVAYLAEFSGWRVLSRMSPWFESQNIVARTLSRDPARLVIFMAHYDSVPASPLLARIPPRFLPLMHGIAFGCMVTIVLCSAAEAVGISQGAGWVAVFALRWTAAAYLAALAGWIMVRSMGATRQHLDGNEAGVAALLALLRRVAANPPQQTDVWCAATGASAAWMAGATQIVNSYELDDGNVHVISLDGLGGAPLQYSEVEGPLAAMYCGDVLAEAARTACAGIPAQNVRRSAFRSDAIIPLSRKIAATTLTSGDAAPEDEAASILAAVDFAEAMLRHIDSLPAPERPPEPAFDDDDDYPDF